MRMIKGGKKDVKKFNAEYSKAFKWFWDGMRGAVSMLTKDKTMTKKLLKDCDTRNNAKRRDVMGKLSRTDLDAEDYIIVDGGFVPCYGKKYTLNDYTKPYIPPDICFEIMEDNRELGSELLNVIYPDGDGQVEVGDRVKVQTKGHTLNGKVGTLIEKRKRQYYNQFECKVELENSVTVILREDELSRATLEVVNNKGENK